MSRVKLYLSGPMTWFPDYNRPAFAAATALLRDAGYHVVSPAEAPLAADASWQSYLKRDLKLMLDCTAIAYLEDWADSRGATLEISTARALGMRVNPVQYYLRNFE